MALNRQDKAAMIEEVSALVANAQSIVVAEYRGLSVDSVTKLRKNARGQGVQLRVLKNTLARRALNGTSFEKLGDKLVGPLVYGFSADPEYCAGKFPVASDADGAISKSFDLKTMQGKPGMKDTRGAEIDHAFTERTTFVIDPTGHIAKVFEKVKPAGHAEEVMAVIG